MSARLKCSECRSGLSDGVCIAWEALTSGGRRKVLLCVRCASPSGWRDPARCAACGVDVYEPDGSRPPAIVACSRGHRETARRAHERSGRRKTFNCELCGGDFASARPSKYCCEAHGKKARRRAKMQPAQVIRLERVKALRRTHCGECGERLLDPSRPCGFCDRQREPEFCICSYEDRHPLLGKSAGLCGACDRWIEVLWRGVQRKRAQQPAGARQAA